MNVKRFIAASLAVFVVGQILGYLIHDVLLRAAYEATKSVWRPDVASKIWIMSLVGFILVHPDLSPRIRGERNHEGFRWFIYGTIEVVILGVVAALVYRPAKPA